MKRITIKDIARELNIHHSTVSRALRNDMSVKKETREKITEFARENGYQINMSALHLRGSVKNTLAVLVPNIHHNFFSNIVSIITNLAYESGYVVSVFQSNESFDQEKEIIKTLIRNNVAGVIASISMETTSSQHFSQLKSYHIPLVFFDRVCIEIESPKITVNNQDAITEVVKQLYDNGKTRIAYISGPDQINVFHDRQMGYLSAISKHPIPYKNILTASTELTIEDGKQAVSKLFSEAECPNAIICDSHLLTLGAVIKLKEMGLKIPEDVALAGFSDNPYIDAINPEIISIVQPEKEIAQAAFNQLLESINNPLAEKNLNIILPARVVTKKQKQTIN